jgi:hypothetical protein
MDSLGTQLGKILDRRFEKIIPDALDPTLLEIFKEMNVNTASGKPFAGQQYDSKYGKRHAKARSNIGLQTGAVDLRYKKTGITQQRKLVDEIIESKKAAGIGFANAKDSLIFYYHHSGTAKGGKIRKIFPELWRHVPTTITTAMTRRIERVFNAG